MPGLRFRAVDAPVLGHHAVREFARQWPAYRSWFLCGDAARPDGRACRSMIARHMPELLGLYDGLLTTLGADEEQACFLSLWCPPHFMSGCTQVVWRRRPFCLIRNYDYEPHLCDNLLLRSAWLGGPVLAMSDCLWGVLDGMNADGLAVSLSFGGRQVSGPGFGITLVLRYILQTCRNAAEALAVLRRVPVHLSYNIALLDRDGGWFSIAIAPDRALECRAEPFSANRQGEHDWSDDAGADSARREVVLAACLEDPDQTEAGLIDHFLNRPLYRPVPASGWGTLYTAAWRPAEGTMQLCWLGQRWRQSLTDFHEAERSISLQ